MTSKSTAVLLRKEAGVTSFSSLRFVKKNINKKTGHCGTLDKFATGLLIACCGKFTKKVPLLTGMDKVYRAVIKFGEETTTLDPEGEVIKTAQVPSFEVIEKQVYSMVGELDQIPPVFSAIHVDGKRSYELARKGQTVEMKSRKIKIYSAKILDWNSPYLTVELHVSKGTYIRSYARDLGEACLSCGYLTALERTKIGPFSLEEAVNWDDIQALENLDEEYGNKIVERAENYRRPE
ncbi:MAG: tRNA pseudouridine(55) synthase TruB [Spirochaetales bacterium]